MSSLNSLIPLQKELNFMLQLYNYSNSYDSFMFQSKKIKNFSIPKEIFDKEINSPPESKLINKLNNNNNNNFINEIKYAQSKILSQNHPIVLKKISKEITEAKLTDRKIESKSENKSKDKKKMNLKDNNLNVDFPKGLSKNISLTDLILTREKIIDKKMNQPEVKSDQIPNDINDKISFMSETVAKKESFRKASLVLNEFDMDKKLAPFKNKLNYNLDRDRFSLQNKKRKSESDSIFYQKIDHVCELSFKN